MGDAAVTPHQSDVVEKCNLCIHRVDQGLKPACIETCPNRARIFGDIDDPNSEVSQAIKGRSYVKILEEKGTKPSIFYLT